MNSHFIIQKHTVHIWRVTLSDLLPVSADMAAILSVDEVARAERLKFDIHKQRYSLSRALLRNILSLYTQISPAKIVFSYGKRGKPFLANSVIKFNVSHSDDVAVFALSSDAEIGIDVEKIQPEFKDDVAKRFFSAEEYNALQQLTEPKKTIAFYRVWAKKEALIKALGEGLFAPLDTFSVSPVKAKEIVTITHENNECRYRVYTLAVPAEYQAAVAVPETIENIDYIEWKELARHFKL